MTFEQAFVRLFGFEGGYVADRRDPGGETKWGISKQAYPELDIAALTRDQAQAIYRRAYWDAVQADRLPAELRYPVFDAAVNSGVGQAVRWLQQALGGVVVDGSLGPVTLRRVQELPADLVRARLLGLRLEALAGLPGWPTFGRGWALRLAALLQD